MSKFGVSPLDPLMWDADAVMSVWDRRDRIDAQWLELLPNVAEWRQSTPERTERFSMLVNTIKADLSVWGVEVLGVFPSGVGGLTVAGERKGQQVVGKWVSEVDEVESFVRVAQALAAVGLGPQVVAFSSHGFLMNRVYPGVPLRSLTPSVGSVVRAAALLPIVRSLPLSVVGSKRDPFVGMRDDVMRLAGDDEDGFGARVLETLDAFVGAGHLAGGPVVAHGDFQLGNLLTCEVGGVDALMVVDGSGIRDSGLLDAGRLVVHATSDALGAQLDWDVEQTLVAVADAAAVNVDALVLVCRALAASTALYIKRCVPERKWESEANDFICRTLA
jgi:hypothetical protein